MTRNSTPPRDVLDTDPDEGFAYIDWAEQAALEAPDPAPGRVRDLEPDPDEQPPF